jgi:hydroxyacylglutathione hydrolase
MIIRMNTGGLAVTNSYLIADEATKQAVIFDAPNDTVAPLVEEAVRQGWDVVGLWLTHGHFDHIADHKIITDQFPAAKVLIHKLDEPKLIDPRSRIFALPFVIPPRKADAYVEDGQVLTFGGFAVRVIFTPGHAPGHVMFYFENEKVLVGGDLIIMGGVGRTDLPDSNHADLEASIRTVMKLPPDTHLLPGHGQPSTLAEELESNMSVRDALSRG